MSKKRKKITAIIVAGGSGKRMRIGTPKPFIRIAGVPLLIYSLDAFEKAGAIKDIVLVCARTLLKKARALVTKKGYKKVTKIVEGGSTRARSVYNGLCACGDASP